MTDQAATLLYLQEFSIKYIGAFPLPSFIMQSCPEVSQLLKQILGLYSIASYVELSECKTPS